MIKKILIRPRASQDVDDHFALIDIQEQRSPADTEVILGYLPDRIRAALMARATDIRYPIEAVLEMAIASFLDTEALGFADRKRGGGQ